MKFLDLNIVKILFQNLPFLIKLFKYSFEYNGMANNMQT